MKSKGKIIGGILGLVFVVFIGAIAYVLTFDPNENKELIAAKFKDATGRDLTLGGEIGLTIYPWLGLTLNDVTVSNAPGFSSTPLLYAELAEVRIKLMPLLNSAYEIDTVRLHGAHINLEVLGNGQTNWDLSNGTADNADADDDSSSAALNNLIIGGVDIQDTRLVYDDQSANTHYEISNLDVAIGELVYGQPLDITMKLDADSRSPQLSSSLNLSGTVIYDVDNERYDLNPLVLDATLRGPNVPGGTADIKLSTALAMDLDADTLTLNNLQFDALDTHLDANIAASRVQTDSPAVVASVNLSGNDLAVLFRILEQNALAQRISSLNSKFSIVASVDADMASGVVTVPSLQANLLGADINGNLNVARSNTETPAVNGKLTASGPDLPTLIEVVGMLQGGSTSPLSQFGRDLARVPDKSFRVQTDFAADMQTGNLQVPELYTSLLGATITGNLTGSRINTETPQLQGALNAQGPDLPLLLQIAGQLSGGTQSALNQYGLKLREGVRNRAFTLSSDFDADLDKGNIQLPTLSATMLGFRLNGKLDARDMQGNNGTVNGSLDLEGDNLREVLGAIDQADLGEVAQSMKLNVAVSGNRSNLRINPFNLSLVLSGAQIPNSPQTLALNANTVVNLNDDSLQAESFSVQGLGLNLSGNASASNLSTAANYKGQLDVPAFNARQLLRQLNQEVPATADATVLQSVAISSAFAGTNNSLSLDNLAIKLDASSITGAIAVNDFNTLASRFTVNVDSIDADRYLAPPVQNTAVASSAPSPLPVDDLKALDINGAINIGQLKISDLNMRSIVLELHAANGELALNPIKADLYEGTFAGDIRLNVNGAQPAAMVSTTLSSINLEPLLKDFMDATYLTGKGNIQLSLTGSGADTRALKSNLNGSGSIGLEDGVLTGVDVYDALGRIETMIRNKRLVEMPQGGQTPFENFSATLGINNGVVSSNDLLIEAPGWKITGAGTLVDLNNDRIDFRMDTVTVPATAPADKKFDISGNTLPIACTGTLSSPRCLPDAQKIISAAVSNVVQQRLGTFLQERLGGTAPQQATDPATDETGEQEAAPEEETEEAPAAEQLLNKALDRFLR